MKIEKCRGCFSEKLETVIDLGDQPWGNDFRSIDSKEIVPTYPLAVDFCHNCSLLLLVAKLELDSNCYPCFQFGFL